MRREHLRLLDELATRIARAQDGPELAMAASVVRELEPLVGPPLGSADDPWVVVARRWARVHRLLGERDATVSLVHQLDQHLAALDDPVGAMLAAWSPRHEPAATPDQEPAGAPAQPSTGRSRPVLR